MNLHKIHPTDIGTSPGDGIQELMRDFLIRTNFVPGVRHVIGWRGLRDVSSAVEGWTAKIKDSAGVFGIFLENVEMTDGWINGRFCLNYFPDPEEELVEYFSLKAGIHVQKDSYISHIRDFLSYPEMRELFNIAIIDLCVNQSEDALILGLESISQQRVIAEDGISISQDGHMVELISPGGFDQDFPSYNTALSFYHVLAASITFNMEEPPDYLRSICQPGTEAVYDSGGRHWEQPSKDAKRKYLYLGYGKADFDSKTKCPKSRVASTQETVVRQPSDEMPQVFKEALWWKAHKISDYKTIDKQILGIDDRPQLIVLTGFLGSGKTSFLQHFIEYQVQLNRFVAIIQNEIGEVGLDGKLLDHDYAVTEIDEGCVCCTLVGNLKNAIHQILSSFHPDYIVLETTGLANPYNLLDEISEVDELVRFDSVTTVVDGQNLQESLDEYEVAGNQIKAADILLLNKIDLLTEVKIKAAKQNLRKVNPTAPILMTAKGDINPALLYSIDLQDDKKPPYRPGQDGEGPHAYHTHQQDRLSSCKISLPEPLDKALFLDTIESLPHTIFRIKGVVDFDDFEQPMLFQYVGGRYELAEFNNPKMEDRFLVLIGQDIQKEWIDSGLRKKFQQNNP